MNGDDRRWPNPKTAPFADREASSSVGLRLADGFTVDFVGVRRVVRADTLVAIPDRSEVSGGDCEVRVPLAFGSDPLRGSFANGSRSFDRRSLSRPMRLSSHRLIRRLTLHGASSSARPPPATNGLGTTADAAIVIVTSAGTDDLAFVDSIRFYIAFPPSVAKGVDPLPDGTLIGGSVRIVLPIPQTTPSDQAIIDALSADGLLLQRPFVSLVNDTLTLTTATGTADDTAFSLRVSRPAPFRTTRITRYTGTTRSSSRSAAIELVTGGLRRATVPVACNTMSSSIAGSTDRFVIDPRRMITKIGCLRSPPTAAELFAYNRTGTGTWSRRGSTLTMSFVDGAVATFTVRGDLLLRQ